LKQGINPLLQALHVSLLNPLLYLNIHFKLTHMKTFIMVMRILKDADKLNYAQANYWLDVYDSSY